MYRTRKSRGILLFLLAGSGLMAQTTECDFRVSDLLDGSRLHQVSGDGRFLIFDEQGTTGVTRLNLETGEMTRFPIFVQNLYSVNEDGTRLAFNGVTGLEIFDFITGTTDSFPTARGVESITLSGNGQRVAFRSTQDFGSNPTNSDEWFLFDAPSGTITQLTDTPPGPVILSSPPGAISYDGRTIAFARWLRYSRAVLGYLARRHWLAQCRSDGR